MTDSDICKTYSDTALEGIIRQLSMTRNWPERLAAAIAERDARRKKLSQKQTQK